MNRQTKTVKYSFDTDNPPELTTEQSAELKALAAMPNETIDSSDIPQMADELWQYAAPVFTKPKNEDDYNKLVKKLDCVLDAGGADEIIFWQDLPCT